MKLKASETLIFDTSFNVERTRLCLRLTQESGGLKIERELIEGEGWAQTQVLCFSSLDELKSFLESDPYYSDYQSKFKQIYAKAVAHICASDSLKNSTH